MNDRMLQLYEVITIWWFLHAHAPTVRELAAACGLRSTDTVQRRLCELRARGLVTWEAGKARTVRLVL